MQSKSLEKDHILCKYSRLTKKNNEEQRMFTEPTQAPVNSTIIQTRCLAELEAAKAKATTNNNTSASANASASIQAEIRALDAAIVAFNQMLLETPEDYQGVHLPTNVAAETKALKKTYDQLFEKFNQTNFDTTMEALYNPNFTNQKTKAALGKLRSVIDQDLASEADFRNRLLNPAVAEAHTQLNKMKAIVQQLNQSVPCISFKLPKLNTLISKIENIFTDYRNICASLDAHLSMLSISNAEVLSELEPRERLLEARGNLQATLSARALTNGQAGAVFNPAGSSSTDAAAAAASSSSAASKASAAP
jgi:hypothetical protein